MPYSTSPVVPGYGGYFLKERVTVAGQGVRVRVNQAAKKIIVRIRRQDRPACPARWEEFAVTARPNMNVISCLQAIAADPVQTNGSPTTPPAWDAVCLEEMCGACTMIINGRPRPACSALVDRVAPDGEPIVLEPLAKAPIVRDLIVDRQRIFNDLKRIKAWVPIGRTDEVGPGPLIPPQLQQRHYALSRCVTCGCCLEVCPQYTPTNKFVGAAVMGQAVRFNIHPVGEKLKAQRLEILLGEGGIAECDAKGSCLLACPKGVPTFDAIDLLGKQIKKHALKRIRART